MPIERFEEIAEWIVSTFEVVPVQDLAARIKDRQSIRGLAAITFDDAYRSIFEHGLPKLASLGVPSTVFIVSSFPDRPSHTWWDILASRGLLTEAARDRALQAQRGIADEVLSELGKTGATVSLPDALLPAGWDQIRRGLGPGVALGSHTARHANLTVLSGRELDDEVARSRATILERTGHDPEILSYPYGLWVPQVARAAGRAGYRAALTLDESIPGPRHDPLALPRVNVPAGISLDALDCWAAGIRPRRLWRTASSRA
jgi:peptidoglycan/xylan/chitin deacetylase (PgdA/CDA1 family)